MKKVTLTKEEAEALRSLRAKGHNDENILGVLARGERYRAEIHQPLNEIPILKLCGALVNDYEVEQTPEEKLKEQYGDYRRSRPGSLYDAYADGMKEALDTLGIEIEGINK